MYHIRQGMTYEEVLLKVVDGQPMLALVLRDTWRSNRTRKDIAELCFARLCQYLDPFGLLQPMLTSRYFLGVYSTKF